MARRSDSSLAALLLTQRLVDTGHDPLKASEYWQLLDAVADPAVLLGSDAAVVGQTSGVAPPVAERIAGLLDAATAFAIELEDKEQEGLRLVSSIDDEYPRALADRLGSSAPPLLYCLGELSLLHGDLLGVVGSRDVSEDAAATATAAGAAAAAAGWGVVSGAAKGVDRLSMLGALEAGGTAVGVLADSLVRMARDPEVRRSITDQRLCLITPYKPTAGFSVATAMGRNKLIYALSRATLVVTTAEGSGGTWAGAEEAMKRRFAPVLVWQGAGAGPGNEALLRRGAVAVDDIARVVEVSEAQPNSDPAAQLRMEL